jgi:hypothetical protein
MEVSWSERQVLVTLSPQEGCHRLFMKNMTWCRQLAILTLLFASIRGRVAVRVLCVLWVVWVAHVVAGEHPRC